MCLLVIGNVENQYFHKPTCLFSFQINKNTILGALGSLLYYSDFLFLSSFSVNQVIFEIKLSRINASHWNFFWKIRRSQDNTCIHVNCSLTFEAHFSSLSLQEHLDPIRISRERNERSPLLLHGRFVFNMWGEDFKVGLQ